MLYVPLDTISKYKSKAFIDMFVLKGAKAIGGGLLLLYTLWLSHYAWVTRPLVVLGIIMIIVWLICARYVGKSFATRSRAST